MAAGRVACPIDSVRPTLILAATQSVSKDYVRNTVANDSTIRDRLPSISQQILSRSRLERIIQDLDLYADMRQTKPMELVVDWMREHIDIKPTEGSESFRVSYEAQSPLVATQVTERLAGFFIEENSRDRTLLARETSSFLESQLENARKRLVEQEKRLETYRLRYGPELPTQLQSESSGDSEHTGAIQSLGEGVNRDRDRRQLVARQLADVQSEQYLAEPVPASGGGARQRPPLRCSRLRWRTEASPTPSHGRASRSARAKRLVADLEARAQKRRRRRVWMHHWKPLTPSEIAKRNKAKGLQAEMESLDRQVAAKLAPEEAELRTALDGYQARVEAVPTRESELIAITRDYDTYRRSRSPLAKKEDSKIAETSNSVRWSSVHVIDPPRLPGETVQPEPAADRSGRCGPGVRPRESPPRRCLGFSTERQIGSGPSRNGRRADAGDDSDHHEPGGAAQGDVAKKWSCRSRCWCFSRRAERRRGSPSHLTDQTVMYERFYGLRERPFNLTSNPRYLLLTSKHAEGSARCSNAHQQSHRASRPDRRSRHRQDHSNPCRGCVAEPRRTIRDAEQPAAVEKRVFSAPG